MSAEVSYACTATLLHLQRVQPLFGLAKYAQYQHDQGSLCETIMQVHYNIAMRLM